MTNTDDIMNGLFNTRAMTERTMREAWHKARREAILNSVGFQRQMKELQEQLDAAPDSGSRVRIAEQALKDYLDNMDIYIATE